MSYKPGQWGEARRDFEHYFHVSLGRFYDGETTVLFGNISIDIFAFDDWLHSVHGEYEDRGLSMADLIVEKYGDGAIKLIMELI
jgi:hypothetical protein